MQCTLEGVVVVDIIVTAGLCCLAKWRSVIQTMQNGVWFVPLSIINLRWEFYSYCAILQLSSLRCIAINWKDKVLHQFSANRTPRVSPPKCLWPIHVFNLVNPA